MRSASALIALGGAPMHSAGASPIEAAAGFFLRGGMGAMVLDRRRLTAGGTPMKWSRGERSSNLEDRRGQPARGGTALKLGGGGAVVAVLVALIGQALGIDLSGMVGGGG